ncbi:Ig-like domain-containing protein [Chromobacterium sp. CV08]|uniref:Ig-like domain-containing protein n=1 Tax=Chromobacterium sp. CV08 TaxID=3133274 RepID=UPI003DA9F9C8
MANSLSVVGGGDIYEFDADAPSLLQVRVSNLTTGAGVPRHRVGFYIPGYQRGVSPSLARADGPVDGAGPTQGVDTDDYGYAAVRIVAGSSRDPVRLNIVIDGGRNGNELISLPLQPKDGELARRVVRLLKVKGDRQLLTTGGGAFDALQVKALDSGGRPVPGARVRFSVSPGTGTTLGAVSPANGDGLVVAPLLAGRTPGHVSVTAVCGLAAAVVFELELAPPPASLELVAWPQTASIVRGGTATCYAQLRTRNSMQGWAFASGQARAKGACLSLSPPEPERFSDTAGILQPVTQVRASRDAELGACSIEFQVELGGVPLVATVHLVVVAN